MWRTLSGRCVHSPSESGSLSERSAASDGHRAGFNLHQSSHAEPPRRCAAQHGAREAGLMCCCVPSLQCCSLPGQTLSFRTQEDRCPLPLCPLAPGSPLGESQQPAPMPCWRAHVAFRWPAPEGRRKLASHPVRTVSRVLAHNRLRRRFGPGGCCAWQTRWRGAARRRQRRTVGKTPTAWAWGWGWACC